MNAQPPRPNGPIDWQQVRQQLANAVQEDAARRLSPERARLVLEERARMLARVPPVAPVAGEALQVVVFSLGEERYALETHSVREVVRLRDHAVLPGAPAFVFGVLNLRGEVLSVLDLRPFFGVPQRGATDRSRVLVLGASRTEFGLLADDVHEVLSVRLQDVLEAPPTVSGAGREYLRGVTPQALIVLDGAVLLRDARLFYQGEDS
jgi:purine-binding chemotaxis protein CheW